jgi:hypothetical protein
MIGLLEYYIAVAVDAMDIDGMVVKVGLMVDDINDGVSDNGINDVTVALLSIGREASLPILTLISS